MTSNQTLRGHVHYRLSPNTNARVHVNENEIIYIRAIHIVFFSHAYGSSGASEREGLVDETKISRQRRPTFDVHVLR